MRGAARLPKALDLEGFGGLLGGNLQGIPVDCRSHPPGEIVP
jgi:hypothetical protein